MIANIISVCVRDTDIVTRYGGEEFVVLLPETELEGALTVAEKIRSELEIADIPLIESKDSIRITASIGVASRIENDCQTPEALMRKADKQLYQAKESGRNQVASELDEKAVS